MNRFLLLLFVANCASGMENSEKFEFHSNLWVNLHHFLYEQGAAQPTPPSDSAEWKAAVDYYRREMVKHDLLSAEMTAINNTLSELDGSASLKDSGLPRELIAVLERVAPV